MESYSVGQVIEKFKYHAEGTNFIIDDDGANLIVFFNNPTQEEIDQFKSSEAFEIRFTELYGVIMITAKIGNLSWIDAPYTVHLSKNLTKITMPQQGQGLGLLLFLVDTHTGEIKSMRLLGLAERFTKNLFKAIMEQKSKPFSLEEYTFVLNKIYAAYTTKQLVKLCKDYCKFV